MVVIEREAQAIAPGNEPEPLKSAVIDFFRAVDEEFPDKLIVWERWDHDRFDKPACTLCEQLGYSAGAPFLTAYGYSIITPNGLIKPTDVSQKPESVKPTAPVMADKTEKSEDEYRTGRIVRILPNKNSGFVHERGTRKDYYFNIRSFNTWIESLQLGREVRFKTELRMDRSRNTMRATAVSLSYIE